MPATVLGTSTVALSDSTTTILSSTAMLSPTWTRISPTNAFSTPISGTFTSTVCAVVCTDVWVAWLGVVLAWATGAACTASTF